MSIGEVCLQEARAFALERRQGRRPEGTGPAPLIDHPDVRRMLTEIAVGVDAARALTYTTAVAADLADHHSDPLLRERARRRLELLTPIAKAWPTDQGVRLASIALQVHGGMGFVEETGIAQRYRDVRIASIYEGTNGIQAIDLVTRKVVRDHGRSVDELLGDVDATLIAAHVHPQVRGTVDVLRGAVTDARTATAWVVERHDSEPDAVLAAASPYLELMALCVAGELLLRRAVADLTDPSARDLARQSVARSEFFALHQIARRPTPSSIAQGSDILCAALAEK